MFLVGFLLVSERTCPLFLPASTHIPQVENTLVNSKDIALRFSEPSALYHMAIKVSATQSVFEKSTTFGLKTTCSVFVGGTVSTQKTRSARHHRLPAHLWDVARADHDAALWGPGGAGTCEAVVGVMAHLPCACRLSGFEVF